MRRFFLRSALRFPEKKENYIVVEFDKLKYHTDVDGRRRHAKKVEIVSLIDNPAAKYVIAISKFPIEEIVLWSGAEYDAIGNWTNDDVIARINELFVNKEK